MELTEKQAQALDIVLKKYRNKEKRAVIAGYAGTGKSVTVKFIVDALAQEGIDPDKDVVYTSFTGKAVQRLVDLGNQNASTLHKLLYESVPRPDGTFFRRVKQVIPYKVVVVDEVSMVSKDLINTLEKHRVFVIYCGDPGQLPPIYPEEGDGNSLLQKPDIFFDEIMRQSKDSGIIQLSMLIREEKDFSNFASDDVKILPTSAFVGGMFDWGDIMLCATNLTRTRLNAQARMFYGKEGLVGEHEKIICNKNYWDYFSEDTENALTNGCIGYLDNVFEQSFQLPKYLGLRESNLPIITGEFTTETGDLYSSLCIDKKLLTEGTPSLDNKQKYRLSKNPRTKHLVPMEFSYGYAITTHKAQGSEWNNVVIWEEQFPYAKDEHKRWLYTAVTRCSKKCVLIR